MANTHRWSIIGAVVVCLAVAQTNVTVFASEASSIDDISQKSDVVTATGELVAPGAPAPRPSLMLDAELIAANLAPAPAEAFAGQIYRGRGRSSRRSRSGSIAAMMVGAAATIAGSAILVYANRPECSADQSAGGCGYGTKVIGGSVLAVGVVGLFVGAMTWR